MKVISITQIVWLKYPDYTPDAPKEYLVQILLNHAINPVFRMVAWGGIEWKGVHSDDVIVAWAAEISEPKFD